MVLLAITGLITRTVQFILCLSFIVIIHELGHFLAAKHFKCRVERFYLFFDPWFSLWKKKIKGTEFGIGWLPLGGYVRIAGTMDDEFENKKSNDPNRHWELRNKPAWQRLIIMLSGIVFNLVLAFMIYTFCFCRWGSERLPIKNLLFGVQASELAKSIGIHDGDIITEVNGQPILYFGDIQTQLVMNSRPVIQLKINNVDRVIRLPKDFTGKISKEDNFLVPRSPAIVDSVFPFINYLYGTLQPGDRILSYNNETTRFVDEIEVAKKKTAQQQIANLIVLRGRDTVITSIFLDEKGKIGFFTDPYKHVKIEKLSYNFFEAIQHSLVFLGTTLLKDIRYVGLLIVSPNHKLKDNVGGIISMAQLFGEVWDFRSLLEQMASLSLLIALFNLIPIPGLDGGHALFALIEMVTGRRPSGKYFKYVWMAGAILLICLSVYALGLDIIHIFT